MNYIYGTIPEDAVNVTYTGLTTESTTTTVDNINRTIKVDTNFDITDFLTKSEASNTYLPKEEGESFVHKGTLEKPSTELIYGTKVFPYTSGGNGIGFSNSNYSGYALLYGGWNDLKFKIYSNGPARLSLESSTHGTIKYGHTNNSNYTAFISSSGGTSPVTCGSGYIVFPTGGTEENPKVVATTDDCTKLYRHHIIAVEHENDTIDFDIISTSSTQISDVTHLYDDVVNVSNTFLYVDDNYYFAYVPLYKYGTNSETSTYQKPLFVVTNIRDGSINLDYIVSITSDTVTPL